MNDGKDSAPVSQGWSPAWIAAKFILAVPILGVVCLMVPFAMGIVGNMVDVCPHGFYVGHFPCDASLIFLLAVLLIAGLGIWFLLWIVRMEAAWKRWRERLERWRR